MTDRVPLEKKVLSENDRIASSIREKFRERGIVCLNFISSPGSGKTMLLERTLERFDAATRVAVLTGDIQTDNDAMRLARYGFPVKQITTAGACHLDARMIERALEGWNLDDFDLMLIENVGNLVCPTSYDLAEEAKIVVLSVTEGEDKPLKYPLAFNTSHLVLITKTDLAPHAGFDRVRAMQNVQRVHPGVHVLELSARTGAGISTWFELLHDRVNAKSRGATPSLSS